MQLNMLTAAFKSVTQKDPVPNTAPSLNLHLKFLYPGFRVMWIVTSIDFKVKEKHSLKLLQSKASLMPFRVSQCCLSRFAPSINQKCTLAMCAFQPQSGWTVNETKVVLLTDEGGALQVVLWCISISVTLIWTILTVCTFTCNQKTTFIRLGKLLTLHKKTAEFYVCFSMNENRGILAIQAGKFRAAQCNLPL